MSHHPRPAVTLAALAVAAAAAGCSPHPPAMPAHAGPHPAVATSAGAAPPEAAAAPTGQAAAPQATHRPAAAAAAVGIAAAFVRAAHSGPSPGGWPGRTRRYSTAGLQRGAPPAPPPPATGAARLLSAQLAADTPSSGRTARVEVAASVTTADGADVPVTGYLTLHRTDGGDWLVDAVASWT